MAVPVVHKFNTNLYNKYNKPAFDVLKNNFKYLYINLREEDYNIDVDIYLNKNSYNKNKKPIGKLEIETKLIWKEKEFPYVDVHFLAKKIKYINQEVISYWVLFNANFTNCGIIQLSKIANNELIQIKCENSYNDWFYKIPKKNFVWGLDNVESFIIYKAFMYQNKIINII